MTGPDELPRFEVSGGRGGMVRVVDGGRAGEFEWEMLLGEASMVVWVDRFWWLDTREVMARADVERLVQAFATHRGTTVALAFPEGERMITP